MTDDTLLINDDVQRRQHAKLSAESVAVERIVAILHDRKMQREMSVALMIVALTVRQQPIYAGIHVERPHLDLTVVELLVYQLLRERNLLSDTGCSGMLEEVEIDNLPPMIRQDMPLTIEVGHYQLRRV